MKGGLGRDFWNVFLLYFLVLALPFNIVTVHMMSNVPTMGRVFPFWVCAALGLALVDTGRA